MAVRGASSKEVIISKMTEIFPGAFIASDGKTLRIPLLEDGTPIEIKVTLTAAKDLEGGGAPTVSQVQAAPASAKPTEDEIKDVHAMLDRFGIQY